MDVLFRHSGNRETGSEQKLVGPTRALRSKPGLAKHRLADCDPLSALRHRQATEPSKRVTSIGRAVESTCLSGREEFRRFGCGSREPTVGATGMLATTRPVARDSRVMISPGKV